MPRQSYDLRLAETKQLYHKVPFSTVADWIQTGRLLEDDEVSPAGGETWQRLDQQPSFAPFFPQPAETRIDDVAEALETVQFDVSWKRPADEEEDDVDMIPLIDISLVLLIFFIMTAGSLLTAQMIETPQAEHGKVFEPGERLVVGMTLIGGQVEYYLGEGATEPISEDKLLDTVAERMKGSSGPQEVLLRANPTLPFERVQRLTMALQARGVKRILPSVAEKPGPKESP